MYFAAMTRTEFLEAIEKHLAETGMSPTTFGKKAVGDPNFVFTLRNGRSPSLSLVERVQAFMTHRPEPAGSSAPPQAGAA
jgi:sulfate adenylyltransferase subunit 2